MKADREYPFCMSITEEHINPFLIAVISIIGIIKRVYTLSIISKLPLNDESKRKRNGGKRLPCFYKPDNSRTSRTSALQMRPGVCVSI